MKTFVLKDVHSDTTIEFCGEVPRGLVDYEDCNFVASIKGQQLSATVTVCDIHPDAWSKFFADIAENWQGWAGEKKSESLEGHLKITVTSDALGHIRVRVLLRNIDIGGQWSADDSVYLEAGQLGAIAMEAKEFFG